MGSLLFSLPNPPSSFLYGSLSESLLLPFTHTYYATSFRNYFKMDKIKEVSLLLPLSGGVACIHSSLICNPSMHIVVAATFQIPTNLIADKNTPDSA